MRGLLGKPEFLVLLVACWFAALCNGVPVGALLGDAAAAGADTTFMGAATAAAVAALTWLLLLLIAPPPLTRPVLVAVLLLGAPVAFFVANHGLLFDADMLANVIETNPGEATELLTPRLWFYAALVGGVPAVAVLLYPLQRRTFAGAVLGRMLAVLLAVVLVAAVYGVSGKTLTAAVRNHREVRYQLVPLNIVLASISAARAAMAEPLPFVHIGEDAQRAAGNPTRPRVHVLIVGETARAANFGLNGYSRDTTPQLRRLPVRYYSHATACGTATRISLPCMFSLLPADGFDPDIARSQDNLLDIAARAGYTVYWRENGNSCKHVCERSDTVDVGVVAARPDCAGEFCMDAVLLDELAELLATVDHDSLIVLHQIGSHGPAYYERYPDEFRRFVPDCRSADFSACSREEIVNAYDNTILYTDHIVAAAIGLLQQQADRFDTSLMYVSDHGESLGENGLYLHGMPRALAPEQQLHVPIVVWSPALAAQHPDQADIAPQAVSHQHLFHSLLGLLDIRTAVYRPELDIFRQT